MLPFRELYTYSNIEDDRLLDDGSGVNSERSKIELTELHDLFIDYFCMLIFTIRLKESWWNEDIKIVSTMLRSNSSEPHYTGDTVDDAELRIGFCIRRYERVLWFAVDLEWQGINVDWNSSKTTANFLKESF